MKARWGAGWLLGLFCCSFGCSPAPALWRGARAAEWPGFRVEVARLRESRPRAPWAAGLHATLHTPRGARTLDARGGIAVAPGGALRMILVGGAGVTVLDAWMTPQRWRIAVPPLSLVRRGGADEPDGLPVGFLRWWFFTPFAGTLFAAAHHAGRDGAGDLLLLRDGAAVIELRPGTCLQARRRSGRRSERVEECASRAFPQPGDSVRYEDETSGLTIDLAIESLAAAPPEEDAFVDPDEGGGG
jgi:hypothetical protein